MQKPALGEVVNPCQANVPFLYPLKTLENPRFSVVFRGYKNELVARNVLIFFKLYFSDKEVKGLRYCIFIVILLIMFFLLSFSLNRNNVSAMKRVNHNKVAYKPIGTLIKVSIEFCKKPFA